MTLAERIVFAYFRTAFGCCHMGEAHIAQPVNALYFVVNLSQKQNGSVIQCVKINQPECSTTVSLLLWLLKTSGLNPPAPS
ncbi:hypothetical protein M1D83_06590 [Enterobacteriaceae bacterium]